MSFFEFLRTVPYVRLLIPFMVGIIFGFLVEVPQGHYWIFCTIILLVVLSLTFSFWNKYALGWRWGVLMHLALVTLGFAAINFVPYTSVLSEGRMAARCTVIENPLEKERSYHVLVRLDLVNQDTGWRKVNEKVLLTLSKKPGNIPPKLNQVIIFKGQFKEIRNFGNPYEFDYKAFINRSEVFYRAYVDSAKWLVKGYNKNFNLKVWALEQRNNILSYFGELGLDQKSFAVIASLMVGDKSYLDQELKSAYAKSGTMHILAVSGMHIALLFWLLQQITVPLVLWRRGKYLRAAFVLLVIWVYALITGLTPSVVRAAVMFSFWMLGQTANKNVNIYNTLSASALLLLIIHPQNLFDVGFQLSYLAVLGIVVFYTDIFNWLYVKNWFLKKGWEMVAVSLAAQLFTLPLTLYYFHQFPNYFLLSNIIALPLSTFILYGSIGALVLAPFKFLWIYIGWILKITVSAMNSALIWIEHLPGSVTSGLAVSGIMAVAIFIVVVAARVFIYNRKAVSIYVLLACSIIALCDLLITSYRIGHSKEIVVYNTSGALVLQYREGFNSLIVVNNSVYNTEKLVKAYNEANMIKTERKIVLKNDTVVPEIGFAYHKGFIKFGNHIAYIWDHKPQFRKRAKVDFLIINKFYLRDTTIMERCFSAKQFLVTSGVFKPISENLNGYFLANKHMFKTLNVDGAWVWGLSKKNDK